MGNTMCGTKVDKNSKAESEMIHWFEDVLEFPSKLAERLSLRSHKLKVKCETKTKDNESAKVVAYVKYRATRKKSADLMTQIESAVCYAIQANVPKINCVDWIEQREIKSDIGRAVTNQLKKAFSEHGIEIGRTRVRLIVPYPHGKTVVDEINAAGRLRAWIELRRKLRLRLRERKPNERRVGPGLTVAYRAVVVAKRRKGYHKTKEVQPVV